MEDGKLIEVIDVKGMPTPEAKIKSKIFRYQNREVPLRGYVKRLNTQVKSG